MIDRCPKISCLAVTANGRLEQFKRCLQSYLDQTYPNRELVVVNEGSRSYQADLQHIIDEAADPTIQTFWLSGEYSLGALRNISLSVASGDIICQWDDDDFSMPHRLATQYRYLRSNPHAHVCYLSDQLHYYFPTKELYWDNWMRYHSGDSKRYGLIPGTLMAYRGCIEIKYPTWKSGEDTVFANRLLAEDVSRVILLSGAGHLHVYSYHGNNVYGYDHHVAISKHRSENRATIMESRQKIISAITYLKLDGKIRVMCSDGLAFVYEAP